MSLISLKDLHFAYRTSTGEEVPVLKGINLEIEAGELVAIQGPSGSGKSTLLYIIGCLLSSYKGEVTVGGQNLSLLSDEQLAVLRNRHIGFVFQQFHLLSKATVLENILLPSLYPSEQPGTGNFKKTAQALAHSVGLEDRLAHFPNQLSGGQQQRVSIARALFNETQIILADEPTGSLDTKTSQQILDLLIDANKSGRTVIIITHDPEIAKQCDKIVYFRDGEIGDTIVKDVVNKPSKVAKDLRFSLGSLSSLAKGAQLFTQYFKLGFELVPLAFDSLRQNKSRSVLTMLGIVIGIAAVLSMVTIGKFTKEKILDSYAEMGVNTLMFHGYPNWRLKASDRLTTVYQSFNWDTDLQPLKEIFSEIEALSPRLSSWDNKLTYAGRSIDSEASGVGLSAYGLAIMNKPLLIGNYFSPFHVETRSAVCVIGYDVFQRLFLNTSPIGEIINIGQRESSYNCRVVGVLQPVRSNSDWFKPNLAVYLPYTFFQGIGDPWTARIHDVLIKTKRGTDVEIFGSKLKAFFNVKYGKSGRFEADSDSVLIAQMNKFLSLFTVLLGAIALVSLGVGGIGITNMMLVSVSERFKEIGIRKAFGATNFSIRVQYLVESVLICGIAGLIGLVIGFILYQSAIFGATKLIPKLSYEWVIDWPALLLSAVSIFVVGILSGITPAIRAERLQVIEALRSE